MHREYHSEEPEFGAVESEPNHIRAVITYNEVAERKRAMHLLSDLTKGLSEYIEFQPLPWSFYLLADEDWRDMAAKDALQADMLIIATSGLRAVSPAMLPWFEDIIRQLPGKEAAVVLLQGSQNHAGSNGPDCLEEVIQSAVRKAGVAYFTTGVRLDHEGLLQRMQQHADMVTPVLERILHQQTSLHVAGEKN